MATPQYTFLVCLLTRFIYWKSYSMFLWMHMFLKKHTWTAWFVAMGLRSWDFSSVESCQSMKSWDPLRGSVKQYHGQVIDSYRDMIVKPRPPSEWKNAECRKGLVKSPESQNISAEASQIISRETIESQVPSVQSVGKKNPPLNPAREKPPRRAGNLFRQWQSHGNLKSCQVRMRGQVVGCGFNFLRMVKGIRLMVSNTF